MRLDLDLASTCNLTQPSTTELKRCDTSLQSQTVDSALRSKDQEEIISRDGKRVLPLLLQLLTGTMDRYVPEGTTVSIHTYSLHRDERYFSPDPNKFWPERWLDDPEIIGRKDFRLVREAWMPFSFGPTMCIGKYLAYQEIRIVVSLLMQKLDFELAKGWDHSSWERELRDHTTMATGALMVTVKPRI